MKDGSPLCLRLLISLVSLILSVGELYTVQWERINTTRTSSRLRFRFKIFYECFSLPKRQKLFDSLQDRGTDLHDNKFLQVSLYQLDKRVNLTPLQSERLPHELTPYQAWENAHYRALTNTCRHESTKVQVHPVPYSTRENPIIGNKAIYFSTAHREILVLGAAW